MAIAVIKKRYLVVEENPLRGDEGSFGGKRRGLG